MRYLTLFGHLFCETLENLSESAAAVNIHGFTSLVSSLRIRDVLFTVCICHNLSTVDFPIRWFIRSKFTVVFRDPVPTVTSVLRMIKVQGAFELRLLMTLSPGPHCVLTQDKLWLHTPNKCTRVSLNGKLTKTTSSVINFPLLKYVRSNPTLRHTVQFQCCLINYVIIEVNLPLRLA